MASDGQIVFEVTADGKRAIADIKDITKAIQQETGKWDKAADESADHMGNSFDGMLKRLAAGFSFAKIGKALVDLGKQAVQAASDLEEVQNVVDVTFGSNAGQIETWAKNAGKQFGLTETQAKKFTSTMGAMLKSSGMAGDEIVQVSTDLAGLAADMASFYNLDFEEAFSKIRSGISGQTMPLKELGIDMSVATLNAFALQKGLSKTFDQMSQAEQTMLRYQYLMQATSDAQGDFSRTTDGYANSVRMLETNLTSLKTNLGTVLLDVINPLLQGINSLFPEDGGDRHSILDDITDIQIKKDEKIAEITEIKGIADELVGVLETIATDTSGKTMLSNLASGANLLDASSPGNWEALLGTLTQVDGLQNIFTNDSAPDNITALAEALSGSDISTTKAEAWKLFLEALSNNADAVSKLTGKSVDETKAWLQGLAQAAGELTPEDAASWNTLMSALLQGVGMGETDEGKKFVELLAQNFLALGQDSDEAVSGLKALGYTTEEIEQKQATWLRTCKELVKAIPGLSEIIDTNTGEVKGGIPAIKEYADQWERAAKYQAEIEAIRSARQVYETNNNPEEKQAESVVAKAKAVAKLKNSGNDATMLDEIPDIVRKYIEWAIGNGTEYTFETIKQALAPKRMTGADVDAISGATSAAAFALSSAGVDVKSLDKFNALIGESEDAMLAYAEAVYAEIVLEKERPAVLEQINAEEERVANEYGVSTEEIEAQTKALEEAEAQLTTYEKALKNDADAQTELSTAINTASEAIKAMTDYAEEMRKSIDDAIDGVVHGLDKVDYHTYKSISDNIDRINASLGDLEEGSDAWETQHKELEKYNDQLITTGTIYNNLLSQKQFLDDYLANLQKAQTMGLDANLLAELSDGSVESAMYLDAIVNDTKGGKTVNEINELYREIQDSKKQLGGALTEQQLTVDQIYQGLVDEAKKAVDELATLGVPAGENARAMVDAIATGVGEEESAVKTAVDGIIAELDRLANLSYSPTITLGLGGLFSFFIPQHETGLDRVPFDGYLASLHEGEGILTAEENRVWQRFKNGRGEAVDYDTMGGVMRDNIKAGGNVYLDGRIVGSVISDQQGKTYRQLQRSGWQG